MGINWLAVSRECWQGRFFVLSKTVSSDILHRLQQRIWGKGAVLCTVIVTYEGVNGSVQALLSWPVCFKVY